MHTVSLPEWCDYISNACLFEEIGARGKLGDVCEVWCVLV